MWCMQPHTPECHSDGRCLSLSPIMLELHVNIVCNLFDFDKYRNCNYKDPKHSSRHSIYRVTICRIPIIHLKVLRNNLATKSVAKISVFTINRINCTYFCATKLYPLVCLLIGLSLKIIDHSNVRGNSQSYRPFI